MRFEAVKSLSIPASKSFQIPASKSLCLIDAILLLSNSQSSEIKEKKSCTGKNKYPIINGLSYPLQILVNLHTASGKLKRKEIASFQCQTSHWNEIFQFTRKLQK